MDEAGDDEDEVVQFVIVIIAGSRTIADVETVARAVLASGFDVTEVISGGARGVDKAGEAWAKARGLRVWRFRPDYNVYGRWTAPLERNKLMAHHGDALVAVWDGKSRGTRHMIGEMRKLGKPVHVEEVRP